MALVSLIIIHRTSVKILILSLAVLVFGLVVINTGINKVIVAIMFARFRRLYTY